MVVRLTREEAEAAYQTHPLHVAVRDEVIKPNVDTTKADPILAVDYAHHQKPKLALLSIGFVAGLVVGALAMRRK